jgi:hypothetical protein
MKKIGEQDFRRYRTELLIKMVFCIIGLALALYFLVMINLDFFSNMSSKDFVIKYVNIFLFGFLIYIACWVNSEVKRLKLKESSK